jgi:cellulose biosynthesis protein BcsQ
MTTIISIMGRKGGIGKTTFAKNICAAASLQGFKTLLIDADGQGNATDGVRVKREDGFQALIQHDASWDDVLRPVPAEFIGGDVQNFFVLPAFDRTYMVEQDTNSPALIYERLSELRGYVDVIVVDLPPGTSNTHIGMYYASDYVLLPTLCELDSVTSLASTIKYLEQAGAEGARVGYPVARVLGIAPNKMSVTERVHQSNAGYVKGRYDQHFTCFSPLRDLAVWRKAQQLRMSIFALSEAGVYAERVEARKAITELAPITNAIFELAKAEAK